MLFTFSASKLPVDPSTRPWKKNKILEEIQLQQASQPHTTSTKSTTTSKPNALTNKSNANSQLAKAEVARMQQLNSFFSELDDFTLEVCDTKYASNQADCGVVIVTRHCSVSHTVDPSSHTLGSDPRFTATRKDHPHRRKCTTTTSQCNNNKKR